MAKKIKLILMLVSIAMSFLGATFWVVLQGENDLQNNVVITLDNDEIQQELPAISFNEKFAPGHSMDYTITLKGDLADDYDVTLDFLYINKDDINALANYLDVTIKTTETKIEKGLKELLDGEKIELGKNATEIDITYYMPSDVGNESQGTSVEFYIELIAKSKNE